MTTLNAIQTLDQLAAILNAAPAADNTTAQSDYADQFGLPRRTGAVDLSALPTFGGEEPRDTLGVWSWDATRLLVGEGRPFAIVTRAEWESRRDA